MNQTLREPLRYTPRAATVGLAAAILLPLLATQDVGAQTYNRGASTGSRCVVVSGQVQYLPGGSISNWSTTESAWISCALPVPAQSIIGRSGQQVQYEATLFSNGSMWTSGFANGVRCRVVSTWSTPTSLGQTEGALRQSTEGEYMRTDYSPNMSFHTLYTFPAYTGLQTFALSCELRPANYLLPYPENTIHGYTHTFEGIATPL
jgi:hypothetical protein